MQPVSDVGRIATAVTDLVSAIAAHLPAGYSGPDIKTSTKGASFLKEFRIVNAKKLAGASFHSLPSATANNPCYLHGVPDHGHSKTQAICVVPSLAD
jgi:hypothetical protein